MTKALEIINNYNDMYSLTEGRLFSKVHKIDVDKFSKGKIKHLFLVNMSARMYGKGTGRVIYTEDFIKLLVKGMNDSQQEHFIHSGLRNIKRRTNKVYSKLVNKSNLIFAIDYFMPLIDFNLLKDNAFMIYEISDYKNKRDEGSPIIKSFFTSIFGKRPEHAIMLKEFIEKIKAYKKSK